MKILKKDAIISEYVQICSPSQSYPCGAGRLCYPERGGNMN